MAGGRNHIPTITACFGLFIGIRRGLCLLVDPAALRLRCGHAPIHQRLDQRLHQSLAGSARLQEALHIVQVVILPVHAKFAPRGSDMLKAEPLV